MSNFVLTEEQRALASSCFLLACKLASKYAQALGLEDAQSVAWVALCRAASYYDPARPSPKTGQPVKFVTLASTAVTRALLAELRGRARRYIMRVRRKSLVIPWTDLAEHYPEGDERQFDPPAPPPDDDEPDPPPPVTELLPALGERERTVVQRVIMQGESNAEVARDMGLSRERVRQILHDGLTTLRQLAVLRGHPPQHLVKPVMHRRSYAPISCLEASYLLGAKLPLTERATQVLTRIAAGLTVAQAARELGVTKAAVYEMLARTRRLFATLEQEAPHAAS